MAMRSGELLREWRDGLGLTQEQAGERLGLKQSMVSEYERGEKSPGVQTALRIARLTNNAVPVDSWDQPSAEETGPHPIGGTRAATGTGEG